ncbi:hypothetical protein CXG81DRAFT_15237, partial [Caulochytrium protostelioides]
MTIHLDIPGTALSVSPTGQHAVLAAKRGLYVLDLDKTWEAPRVFQHMTSWESQWTVQDVQWNPHLSRSSWIATTSNQRALVWNIDRGGRAAQAAAGHEPATMMPPAVPGSTENVEFILQRHKRTVVDLNWSPFHPESLVTCSYDSWVHLWDLRRNTNSAPAASFCAWTAAATQVKFNKQNAYVIASSHDTDVRLWDLRKGSTPVVTLVAHMAKVYGIDWRPDRDHHLVTCGQDGLVKMWDTHNPRVPQCELNTGSPVWRARFTPFDASHIVTMAQRRDCFLSLWNLDDLSRPVHVFTGHRDLPREFVWRRG